MLVCSYTRVRMCTRSHFFSPKCDATLNGQMFCTLRQNLSSTSGSDDIPFQSCKIGHRQNVSSKILSRNQTEHGRWVCLHKQTFIRLMDIEKQKDRQREIQIYRDLYNPTEPFLDLKPLAQCDAWFAALFLLTYLLTYLFSEAMTVRGCACMPLVGPDHF